MTPRCMQATIGSLDSPVYACHTGDRESIKIRSEVDNDMPEYVISKVLFLSKI